MRVLNVAEKPSVAKTITQILSGGNSRRRNGLSRFNHIFDFDYQLPGGSTWSMVVTSVTGHMMNLEFDERYRKWSSCDPVDLFDAPIRKSVCEDKKPLEDTLKREARNCQKLVLWLDCDREGENISYEVINVCRSANANISLARARFSALIPRDIHNALQTLEEPRRLESEAVDARQEIDLRIGAAFTRFMTQRLQTRFSGLDKVISYGPCQFPTLGFVVKQHLKVQNFVSQDFWSISMSVTTNGDGEGSPRETAQFRWSRTRLFDRAAVFVLYEMCVENPQVTITDVRERTVTRHKPLPLATVELQKQCTRLFRMSGQHVMDVAEKLYQSGHISYPRTETDKFKEGTDLMGLIRTQTESPAWGAYAQSLLDGAFNAPRDGGHDDSAHPPIHPTKFVANLQDNDQKKIFEYIVRHFLACCSADAKGSKVTVTANIAGEVFYTSGTMVLELNYYEVFTYEKWRGNTIPAFAVNQTFMPTVLEMTESRTQAPSLLSESQLISLMDKNGIGTDATIAQHIVTIQDRDYAFRTPQHQFQPTPLGIALVQGYDQMGSAELANLSEPFLRANMERDIGRVSDGSMAKQEFLDNCLASMKMIFIEATRHAESLDDAVAGFFGRVGSNRARSRVVKRGISKCGRCNSLMDLHSESPQQPPAGGRGAGMQRDVRYVFCTACDRALTLSVMGDLAAREPSFDCPICKFQVLQVSKPDGKSYPICPYCFSNPPNDQKTEQNVFLGGFRCFQCSSEQCSLASSQSKTIVKVCPKCGPNSKGISLRKVSSTWVLSCTAYPRCMFSYWMQGVRGAEATQGQCATCGGRHLKIKFNRGSIDMHIPTVLEGCVFCHPLFREVFEPAQRRQAPRQPPRAQARRVVEYDNAPARAPNRPAPARPAPARSAPARPVPAPQSYNSQANQAHQNNPQGPPSTCFLCGKSGHFAPSCPSSKKDKSGSNRNFGAPKPPSGSCYKCGDPGHWANNCPD
eukprot:137672_1